jgi:hypothetical protein
MQFASFEEGHVATLSLRLGRKVIVSTGRSKDGSIGSLAVAPDDFVRPLDAISSKKSGWCKTLGLHLTRHALKDLVQEAPRQTIAEIVRCFYSNCFHYNIVEQSGGSSSPRRLAELSQNRNLRQEQTARLT